MLTIPIYSETTGYSGASGGITPTGTIEITENQLQLDVSRYAYADVSVPNTYTAADEGKVVSDGELVTQSSRTITENGTYDTTENNQAIVNVPNSYTAADEGKVVSDGALVSQTNRTITENGTYDTTLISELIADIAGVVKTLLYTFNQSQGSTWINTNVDISNISTLLFEDVQSDNAIKSTIIDVENIEVYTGGSDVYTVIYTQNSKDMNARIYNNLLYISYNGVGTSAYVTKIYSYN